MRLGAGDAPRAQERLREGRNAGRLVVELDVVAHLRALHERGVDPVDPGPAPRGVHGPGGAEHQNRGAVTERVEDRHARVLQAHDVVHDRRHRCAPGLGVAVGHRHRDLLVRGQDQLGRPIAAVVDERVVQPAVGRPGIERDVFDADGAQQVDDEVGAVGGCRFHTGDRRHLTPVRPGDPSGPWIPASARPVLAGRRGVRDTPIHALDRRVHSRRIRVSASGTRRETARPT